MLSRRRLFGSIAALSTVPYVSVVLSFADRSRVERPFEWDDAYRRVEVESATISPTGLVAFQITRALSAGGVYGGFSRPKIQPRGEIWLLEPSSRDAYRLDVGDLWVWSPSFSPGGTFLAALASRGDGRVGLIVWDIRTHRSRLHLDINLDIYGVFGHGKRVESRPSPEGEHARQFLWTSEETLLFTQSDQTGPQFDMDLTSADSTFPSLHRQTAAGLASVRVWNADSPVCRAQGNVASLTWRTGDLNVIFRGAVRGASLSPDGRWLVVLTAAGHLLSPKDSAMSPGLFSTDVGDDPLVWLRACVLQMTGSLLPRWIEQFQSVGAVAPRRLPRWSAGSDRFSIPSRLTYSSQVSSGDDACWCIETDSLRAECFAASSALDAELIATLSESVPLDRLGRVLEQRPVLASSGIPSLSAGEGPGIVWRDATGVFVWDRQSLKACDGQEWRVLLRGCRSIYPPTVDSSASDALVLLDEDVAHVVGDTKPGPKIAWNPDWELLGVRPDNAILARSDDARGTVVFFVPPAGSRHQPPVLTLNRHFSKLAKPVCREVIRVTSEGRQLTGKLQLPVHQSAARRAPVILWAYPNSDPVRDPWITRTNSQEAIWRPFQYLLTQGFAVFHAPLPMPEGAQSEPLQFIADSILPWLGVLNQQPEVLPDQFGFFGHSDAGIVALALEALSHRFRAIVAHSTFPDLGATPLGAAPANVALDCAGDVIQANRYYYEYSRQPYGFGTSFWDDTTRFLRNSPLYHLQSATTPLLLLQSEFDYGARAMETVYSILHGRGIPVELTYYWGEGHLLSSPGNIRDLWERTARFFGTYLYRDG